MSVWTDYPDALDRLKALWAQGVPASAIADIISREFAYVSKSNVCGARQRYGLPERRAEGARLAAKAAVRSTPETARPHPWFINARASKSIEPSEAATDLSPERSPYAVSLMRVREGQCRWPLNDPGPDFLFCGAPQKDGCSYCERHWAISRSERRMAAVADGSEAPSQRWTEAR